jgi:integrase
MAHIEKKSNGKFLVQWTNAAGNRLTRTVPNKAAAQELEAAEEVRRVRETAGIFSVADQQLAAAEGKPLSEHLSDWRSALESKGGTVEHPARYVRQVTEVIAACGWVKLSQMNWLAAANWIDQQRKDRKPRPMRQATANHFRKSLRQFGAFLVDEDRVAVNPFKRLKPCKVTDDQRAFFRGELTAAELASVFQAADLGGAVKGMTGPDRGLFYRVRFATALRVTHLRPLTPESFDLDRPDPVIWPRVKGKIQKRRPKPIGVELAAMLRPWLDSKPARLPVFDLPHDCDIVRMWRKDLEVAGVAEENGRGERRDFYATRHTSISSAMRSVGVKSAQDLAGHSTSKLTIDVYGHLDGQDHAKMLAGLPVVPRAVGAAPALQTGVSGSPLVSTPDASASGAKSASNQRKTPRFGGVRRMGRAGIEPATHGFSVHCSTN